MSCVRGFVRIAVLALLAAGCSAAPCAKSPNVLVTLEGPAPTMNGATSLLISISVGGGASQSFSLPLTAPLTPGHGILLAPRVPPAGPSYALSVQVSTLDAAMVVLGTGTAQDMAEVAGCNKLMLTLVGMSPPPPDLAMADLAGVDLAGADFAMGPDMAVCMPATPDEDGDARPDACDLCPANADPGVGEIDSDHDGMPDACDPQPITPGDARLRFDSFNSAPNGWSSVGMVQGGLWTLGNSTSAGTNTTDTMDGFPASIMLQTYATTVTEYTSTQHAEDRLYAWTTIGSSGYACLLWHDTTQATPTYYLVAAVGAVGGNPDASAGGTRSSVAVPASLVSSTPGRLRLFLTTTAIRCEWAMANGSSPVTTSQTLGTAPGPTIYAGLGAWRNQVDFYSFFAASMP